MGDFLHVPRDPGDRHEESPGAGPRVPPERPQKTPDPDGHERGNVRRGGPRHERPEHEIRG